MTALLVGWVATPALGAPKTTPAQRADSRTLAAFTAQTAPRPAKGRQAVTSLNPGGSAASGIGRSLSGYGGGGMGFPLPVLLILSLLIAVGFGVWRVAHRARPG
jgi:uncharacterized membrane protein